MRVKEANIEIKKKVNANTMGVFSMEENISINIFQNIFLFSMFDWAKFLKNFLSRKINFWKKWENDFFNGINKIKFYKWHFIFLVAFHTQSHLTPYLYPFPGLRFHISPCPPLRYFARLHIHVVKIIFLLLSDQILENR